MVTKDRIKGLMDQLAEALKDVGLYVSEENGFRVVYAQSVSEMTVAYSLEVLGGGDWGLEIDRGFTPYLDKVQRALLRAHFLAWHQLNNVND